jgi:hypothetical protein
MAADHRTGAAINRAITGLPAARWCQLLISWALGAITGWPQWPNRGGTYEGGEPM